MHLCMHTHATVQKPLYHESYCELILSLARASCRLSFATRSCRPSCCLDQTRRPTLFAQEISKSTLAHDAVVAAVSHKHHSIIRVGAVLIQFVYGSHSRLATKLILHKILFPPFFSQAFKWSISLGVQFIFTTNKLVDRIRNLRSHSSQND